MVIKPIYRMLLRIFNGDTLMNTQMTKIINELEMIGFKIECHSPYWQTKKKSGMIDK